MGKALKQIQKLKRKAVNKMMEGARPLKKVDYRVWQRVKQNKEDKNSQQSL